MGLSNQSSRPPAAPICGEADHNLSAEEQGGYACLLSRSTVTACPLKGGAPLLPVMDVGPGRHKAASDSRVLILDVEIRLPDGLGQAVLAG